MMNEIKTPLTPKWISACVASGLLLTASAAHSALVQVDESAFIAGSGLITFSEFAIGTLNPHYNPSDYGGGAGDPTVDFEGWFMGQSLSGDPATDCPGGNASGCVVGMPSGPLALDSAAPDTAIRTDTDTPTTPVLSGTPLFNGPIAILFDLDQSGVGLTAGFFNAAGGTAITAFARDGTILGQVVNTLDGPCCDPADGIEFLGLATDDGSEQIAGLLFSLVGAEPAGYAIDNIRFGARGEVVVPGVSEPATTMLLAIGLFGLGAARRRARTSRST